MTLKSLPYDLTVCKIEAAQDAPLNDPLCFLCKTDEELSLVCLAASVPASAYAREDGFCAFRVSGALDFGLVGILSRITTALAARGVPVFAVSTYNTDYLLIKREYRSAALNALAEAGFGIEE